MSEGPDGRHNSGHKVSQGRPEGGLLGLLRAAGLIAVVAGAGGSVGLMLRAGHRNPSLLLLVLFALWVLSPFMALVWANVVSKRWSLSTQATLYVVMFAIMLGCLAIYGAHAFGLLRAKTGFVFLVVPAGGVATDCGSPPDGRDDIWQGITSSPRRLVTTIPSQ